jgi:RimJ/RimL family protein N-acetyltransferase
LNELSSKRLRFINSDSTILEKILEGKESLADHLKIEVPDGWEEFEEGPFRFVLDRLGLHPDQAPWWNWLAILKEEKILIDTCGYKGPPRESVVEIGYGVISSYRGIGLATEIAAVLTDHAFGFPEISMVMAHTLPEENASCNVLRKCGFHHSGEVMDPEDGLIWRWELERET